jgi:hypothetical protein
MSLVNFRFLNYPKIIINNFDISNNYLKSLKFDLGGHTVLCNKINEGKLFGLKLSVHLILSNKINKGQLFGLKSNVHLILCNKINKNQLFGL